MKFETVLDAMRCAMYDGCLLGRACEDVEMAFHEWHPAYLAVQKGLIRRERQQVRFRAWLLAHNAAQEADAKLGALVRGLPKGTTICYLPEELGGEWVVCIGYGPAVGATALEEALMKSLDNKEENDGNGRTY